MTHTRRPVLVTGAASGMGHASARALSAAGHPVALLDRDADGLAAVAAELRAAGAEVACATADVTDDAAVAAAVAELAGALGPCWGVAAVAGVLGESRRLADTPTAMLTALLAVNVHGFHSTVRHALPGLVGRGDGGRIVGWASDAAIGAVPGFGAYGAAKAAVISLCKTLAAELGEHGVTANAILPGPVDTPLAAYLSQEQKRASQATVPIRRWVTPEEVAALVVHLMSPAGAGISGAALPVDGGGLAARGLR